MSIIGSNLNNIKRSLPMILRYRVLMCGSNLIAVIILCIFIIILLYSVTTVETVPFWKFLGPLRTTQGTVTGDETVVNRSSSKNNRPTYEVRYSFTPDGSTSSIQGATYYRDRYHDAFQAGDKVTVEYKADHPSYSRVKGLNHYESVLLIFFVNSLFLLMSIIWSFSGIRRGISALRVIQTGETAVATLTSGERFRDRNRKSGWRLCFDFIAQDGRQATAMLEGDSLKPSWSRFLFNPRKYAGSVLGVLFGRQARPTTFVPTQSAPQEIVFYNPDNPQESFVPAEVGNDIYVDQNGNISSADNKMNMLSLLPWVIIAGLITVIVCIITK